MGIFQTPKFAHLHPPTYTVSKIMESSISVFELFSIGIGPSSSHTVGPMRAAYMFGRTLQAENILFKTRRVQCDLYGSLSATGIGHGTPQAVMLGLEGQQPEEIDPNMIPTWLEQIEKAGSLCLLGLHRIPFRRETDLLFRREVLPEHPNGMSLTACDADGEELLSRKYYSVGGGFVLEEGKTAVTHGPGPYPFNTAAELLAICENQDLSISEIVMTNELTWRSADEIRSKLLEIWDVMQACVQRGLTSTGILPGGLGVPRRAPTLYQKLCSNPEDALRDPLNIIDWVNLYALAVNEENAAGGRVVTAPTNGAAGIIPAVLHYWTRFRAQSTEEIEEGVVRFLLTAAAIGMLYKKKASISGAAVGCQGEVGVACSMAAGALTELRGGTPSQVENAAEIGMEHNLGLTCDPIAGLVQSPCIERNAMASVKAINASRIALRGDGRHFVSLDKVIKTMRDTGADMSSKYKETSLGGLAVNVIAC